MLASLPIWFSWMSFFPLYCIYQLSTDEKKRSIKQSINQSFYYLNNYRLYLGIKKNLFLKDLKVKVILRTTVSRSVGQSFLVSGHHQGPWPIFLSSWNFRQLWVSYFVEIYSYNSVQVLQNSRAHSTFSYETKWILFLSPLTTRRDYGGGILTRLHTGEKKKLHGLIPLANYTTERPPLVSEVIANF
jgi:hypothetical protein